MSLPMPADTSFHITKRSLDSGYTMPTLEAASDYYEIGYLLSGDRLAITPGGSYTLREGTVGTMPPFVYHRTIPLSNVPYNTYLVKFKPDFVRPLTDAFGHTILEEVYSRLFNRFPPSAGMNSINRTPPTGISVYSASSATFCSPCWKTGFQTMPLTARTRTQLRSPTRHRSPRPSSMRCTTWNSTTRKIPPSRRPHCSPGTLLRIFPDYSTPSSGSLIPNI